MCFAPQRCALFRHLNFQKYSEAEGFRHFDFEMCFTPQRHALFQHPNFKFWLRNVLRATTACTFSTSQLPILTSTCALHHNGVHFFNISISKCAPNPSVFSTSDFEMCFAPQQRALFRHCNFQKCSEREVLLAFSLPKHDNGVQFSSLISPDGSAYFSTLRSHKSLEKTTFSRACLFFPLI